MSSQYESLFHNKQPTVVLLNDLILLYLSSKGRDPKNDWQTSSTIRQPEVAPERLGTPDHSHRANFSLESESYVDFVDLAQGKRSTP
jgi:hypothetical protein